MTEHDSDSSAPPAPRSRRFVALSSDGEDTVVLASANASDRVRQRVASSDSSCTGCKPHSFRSNNLHRGCFGVEVVATQVVNLTSFVSVDEGSRRPTGAIRDGFDHPLGQRCTVLQRHRIVGCRWTAIQMVLQQASHQDVLLWSKSMHAELSMSDDGQPGAMIAILVEGAQPERWCWSHSLQALHSQFRTRREHQWQGLTRFAFIASRWIFASAFYPCGLGRSRVKKDLLGSLPLVFLAYFGPSVLLPKTSTVNSLNRKQA